MADDPAGKLANGALFVPPAFYNLTKAGFGYANLDDQMLDASLNWAKGAGVFAGNNVPKYNGLAGSDPNGTFGGGFATMAPTVGGGTYGATAYSGGYNPFAGRGLLNGGGGGAGGGGGTGGGTPVTNGPGVGTQPPGGTGAGGVNTRPAQSYNTMPGATPGAYTPGAPVDDRVRAMTYGGPAAGGYTGSNAPAGLGSMTGGSPESTATTNVGMAGLLSGNTPPPKSAGGAVGMAAGNAAAQGNPAGNWNNNQLPAQGSNADLLARTMAASNSWNVGGTGLQGLLGSNEAMHQAGNAYNAGGSRYGGTWDTNYAAVAQNPAPYVAAGIAKANPDGTYELLKMQDKESQQWIPIADWQAKYGNS